MNKLELVNALRPLPTEQKFELLLNIIVEYINNRAGEHSVDVAWSILREFERNIHILVNAIYQGECFHFITMIHMQKVSKTEAERATGGHPHEPRNETTAAGVPPLSQGTQMVQPSQPSQAPEGNVSSGRPIPPPLYRRNQFPRSKDTQHNRGTGTSVRDGDE